MMCGRDIADMGRMAHFCRSNADWVRVRRSLRIVVTAVLLVAVSACGGGTELYIADPDLDPVGESVDAAPETGGGDPSAAGPSDARDADKSRAPVTETRRDASPADRQSRQSVGASTVRTTGDVADDPSIDEATESSARPSESPADLAPDPTRAPSSSTSFGTEQRDVPLPRGTAQQVPPLVSTGAPGPAADLDERILAEVSAPEVSCQPGFDAECTEAEVEPVGNDSTAAGTNPVGDDPVINQQVGSVPAAVAAATSDDVCPPGAATSCADEPATESADFDGETDNDDVSMDEDEIPSEAECEIRFWDRGCGGPQVVENDADYFEREAPAEVEPAGEGVDVPQAVIDVLLTPPGDGESDTEQSADEDRDASQGSETRPDLNGVSDEVVDASDPQE